METKIVRKVTMEELDRKINEIEAELASAEDVTTEEYKAKTEALVRLYDVKERKDKCRDIEKETKTKRRVKADTIVQVGGSILSSIAGILLIGNIERDNTIVTKAFGWIHKPK